MTETSKTEPVRPAAVLLKLGAYMTILEEEGGLCAHAALLFLARFTQADLERTPERAEEVERIEAGLWELAQATAILEAVGYRPGEAAGEA